MKLDKSREMFERSKRSLAGGLSSWVRSKEPVPLFFKSGKGSKLVDVDGNEYIDYILGQGPDIFGHAPDFLREAVIDGMRRGQMFGGQHEAEIRVSELMQRVVPCADLVRFSSSGTEAVQSALMLARGHTGRDKIIKFEGHYHGWMDNINYQPNPDAPQAAPDEVLPPVPMSAGVAPSMADSIILVPWNDIDVLRRTVDEHAGEIAAIITEAIMCNSNVIFPKPGYLEGVRSLCNERDIVLIFDEVITGFRVSLGGAQELLGVTPDIATFAKAMAGGFPVSMIAGRREIMSQLEDSTVWHGGTANGNFQAMYAVEAELQELMADDGAVYKQLYATSNRLMEGLRALAQKHEQPLLIQGPGPTFHITFTEAEEITDYRSHARAVDDDKYSSFRAAMLERGVRLNVSGQWYVSTAHSEEDIEATLAAADEAMASL